MSFIPVTYATQLYESFFKIAIYKIYNNNNLSFLIGNTKTVTTCLYSQNFVCPIFLGNFLLSSDVVVSNLV